jgi:hypothetical protein
MPPLSFLKSDKSPSGPSTPEGTSATTASRYHPSRLLRRKLSVKAGLNLSLDSETEAVNSTGPSGPSEPPTASTQSTVVDQQDGSGWFARPRRASDAARRKHRVSDRERQQDVVVIDGQVNGESVYRTATPADRRLPQHPLVDPKWTPRQPSPSPDPATYPTALSPPRRPMPKSPRARAASKGPSTPPHTHQPLGALRKDISPRRGSSPTLSSSASSRDFVPSPPGLPSLTAEWLARPPSSASRLARKNSIGAERIKGRERERDRGGLSDSSPLPRRRLEPGKLGLTSSSRRNPSSSSTEDTELDSDGEIGAGPRRRSLIRANARDEVGYEVEVSCAVPREGNEEMRWEVIIRRKGGKGGGAPSSPLQLSTASSIAQAPSSASSINLSLALDQPTGKLVFIAFPIDIHGTPTKRKPTHVASPGSTTSTPPGLSPATSTSLPSTTTARKDPSERQGTISTSPPRSERHPASPTNTPRRTPLVTAAQLDGGLYAKGTVDGLSEDLGESLMLGAEVRS